MLDFTETPRSSFELFKWYLDCVSDGGDVFIAYAAEVRWRALAIRYASTLVQRAGEETRVEATLRSAPFPVIHGDTLTWSAPPLRVAGRWTSLSPPVGDTILARGGGSVAWRCHQPLARAEVVFDSAPPIRGLGYTESLRLTLPPWRLPIDELRWGRFLADDASLVWIDWRGPHTKQLVLFDGAPLGAARIDDHGLAADGFELVLSEPRVLRQGALGKTALSILPAAETLLPLRILATDERKWIARGTLDRTGHGGSPSARRRSEGWVIHEVVRWP